MRLLYVVQAYGREVFGGAESHCRMLATRLAARGHEVHVLTSCARSYHDWANEYAPGIEELDGVTVHRLPVDHPRDLDRFAPLSGRVLTGYRPEPLFLQDQWVDLQGPNQPGLGPWIEEHAAGFDVAAFFTYLYAPTVRGLPMASGRVATVLHPLAHDEPHFALPLVDAVLTLPDGMAFNVEEEASLTAARISSPAATTITGIGTDLDVGGFGAPFRSRYGLADVPYLLCVGRIEAAKGSDALLSYFDAFQRRHDGDLRLVLLGEPMTEVPERDDIVVTGYVDPDVRRDALDGALASVHPSYFESFSMTLIEAWAQRRPAVVNRRCNVLAGQAARSGGALAYDGFPEFEAAVELLLEDRALGERLGASGRAYVESRYSWERVLERYEAFLDVVRERFARSA